MKKVLSLLLCFLLMMSMALVAFAAPTETLSSTGGEMTLTTEVPTNHEITITYNDGGYVLIDGVYIASGTKITVPRLEPLNVDIITKPEVHIQKVEINGEDKTEDLKHGRLTFEDVHNDMHIVFALEKCADVVPPQEDHCLHLSMQGNVYRGEDLLPDAKLDFDLGSIQVAADSKGAYQVETIKDGRHKVTISNAKDEVLGEALFVIEKDADLTEPIVEKLPDGTQIVRIPKDTKEIRLDFVVQDDGSILIRPSIEIPGTPEMPTKPSISQTGVAYTATTEFYGLTFSIATFLFSILLLIPLFKRKEEKEED